MKFIKIKQKKNSFDKLVSSSFLALFVVVFMYIYQNINIVFNMIDYKKSITKIESLESQVLTINTKTIDYKKTLSLDKNYGDDFKKVNSSRFVVRKNHNPSVTMLYDIK